MVRLGVSSRLEWCCCSNDGKPFNDAGLAFAEISLKLLGDSGGEGNAMEIAPVCSRKSEAAGA